MPLIREKLAQAVELVRNAGVDAWLTFVRETYGGSDPVRPLLVDGGLTWQSALLVFANGKKVAIVGNYDADPLIAGGHWDEVVPYVQTIRPALLEVLDREIGSASPRIAVNYSPHDVKADGLTHGMYLLLQETLAGTRFEGVLESADMIVTGLRGVKSPTELSRIRSAVKETQSIFQEVNTAAQRGMSERNLYDYIQARIRERGLGFSWDPAGNPIVNFGPNSMIGHGVPSPDIRLEDGQILHIDLGVTRDGYSSDLQRCWYMSPTGSVPVSVTQAFDAVNRAITAAASVLRPGVQGVAVDAAARASIVQSVYPEYLHAVGHQVGRVAHDGGGILGPAWDRYGNTPFVPVEQGQVYTLELGVTLSECGYIGLEEMVLVTAEGVEWISERQERLWVIV